jgi:DNA repair exonuclease SbcCD ATPase subunit
MKTLLIILTLLCAFPVLSQAKATGKRPVNAENNETAQLITQTENTLQEHQKRLEVEKKATEKKLARLASKKQKSAQADREQLKNRLKKLEATLKSIQRDQKTLASTRNEYQKKFGSPAAMQAREKAFKKPPLATQRDILAIELSEPSKNAMMSEILNKKDAKRLMQIVAILIDHTGTMDAQEKEYWRNLPPDIPFEHRFRLLEILATERQKLAALERTHKSDIQQLNKQHMAEWQRVCAKDAGDKKCSPPKSRSTSRH